jgi:hypothetical protein
MATDPWELAQFEDMAPVNLSPAVLAQCGWTTEQLMLRLAIAEKARRPRLTPDKAIMIPRIGWQVLENDGLLRAS